MHWIDPDSLPEITGTFELFLLNPKGHADGMILDDGREVHFPPHMGADIVAALATNPKAPVRIRAVKPREADVFVALALQVGDGPRFEDRGPPDKPAKHDKAPKKHEKPASGRTLSGVVRRPLHGPKGERRGLLLRTGEIVRFPPHAEPKAAFLKAGAKVAVAGKSLLTPLGEVVEAERIGKDEDNLHRLEPGKHG